MTQKFINKVTDVKNMIIAFLLIMLVAITFIAVYNSNKADAANDYIHRLEQDYPDYMDTSMCGDEYYEYSKYM